MKFTLKATGFSIDEALKKYVDMKVVSVLGKFLKRERILDATTLDIEIALTSRHHAKGKIWRAEANAALPHAFLRCEVVAEDMREAIDLLAEELTGEIIKYKEKTVSRMKRGARAEKSELKLDPAARTRRARR